MIRNNEEIECFWKAWKNATENDKDMIAKTNALVMDSDVEAN